MQAEQNSKIILVVEDNPDHAYLLKHILDSFDFNLTVRHAVDGLDALHYIMHQDQYADPSEAPSPDAMLLDLRLPKLSGHELLAELKKLNRLDFPVIIVSSSSAPADVEQSRQFDIYDYITKPVSIPKLRDLLLEIGFREQRAS